MEHAAAEIDLVSEERRAVVWEDSDTASTASGNSSEVSKRRLTESLDTIQVALTRLQNSMHNILNETRAVDETADTVNLLLLQSAIESVLLQQEGFIEPARAADIKEFALSAMRTAYEVSSSMEKLVDDLAVISKSVKQTEGSLRYILNGAEKLHKNIMKLSGSCR